jgi:hypothetical protein
MMTKDKGRVPLQEAKFGGDFKKPNYPEKNQKVNTLADILHQLYCQTEK